MKTKSRAVSGACPAEGRKLAWGLVLVLGPFGALIASQVFQSAFAASVAGLLLAQLLAITTYTDFKRRRIPNQVTYTTVVAAFVLNLAATGLLGLEGRFPVVDVWGLCGGDFAQITRCEPFVLWGAIGIQRSMTGAVCCFAIMLLVYRLSGTGAGDVKLATAIGALVGATNGVQIILVCHIVAGAVTLIASVWRIGPWVLAKALTRGVAHVVLPLRVLPPDTRQMRYLAVRIPLAGYFAVGTIIVLLELYP